MHLAPLIKDLAIILAVAALMSLIFRSIKQPVVLGYLLAGIIVGPHTPPVQLVTDIPTIQTLAELGVIFLMFTLGLEFSFRKLAQVGFSAFITATAEVIFFMFGGYALGRIVGWTQMESIFLGAMLSISSTTIVIKALDEMNLKKHRFAQLIFGVLIVEDLYAILMLVGLSTLAQDQSFSLVSLSLSAIKLLFVIGSWFITGFFLVPRLIKFADKVSNPEMTTIISLGFCLTLVVFANYFGYSSALGAFIMGSILAETSLISEIEQRMEPLKDMFGAIFFVSIGMLIDPAVLYRHMGLIGLICAFTIVGKIVSKFFGALASGQTPAHSLQVGMGLAQIGEFSFIIASLGMVLKVINEEIYPIIVAVSLVTTFTTPFLIKISLPLGLKLENNLPPKFKDLTNRYSLWLEHYKSQLRLYEYQGKIAIRWLISGMTMTLIFLLSHHFSGDLIKNYGVLFFFIPFLASLPFIWSMLFGHRRFLSKHNKPEIDKLSVFISPVLTFAWIVILSALFFPLKYVLPVCAVFLTIFIGLTYKKLESSYHWFEKHFMASFSDKKKEDHEIFSHLAPWNIHLVNLKVHSNSQHVQKTLIQAQLRVRLGINVVAIKRGLVNIVAPGPHEAILPGDELIVLGTDEQIDQLKEEMEKPGVEIGQTKTLSDYELIYLSLEQAPLLAGKSIRQSGIRENFHALIVGIERAGTRITNPDTDSILLKEDKIWLVGGRKDIERLVTEKQ